MHRKISLPPQANVTANMVLWLFSPLYPQHLEFPAGSGRYWCAGDDDGLAQHLTARQPARAGSHRCLIERARAPLLSSPPLPHHHHHRRHHHYTHTITTQAVVSPLAPAGPRQRGQQAGAFDGKPHARYLHFD